MTDRFCQCRRCRKLRREKGVVLGGRNMGFWLQGVFGWMNVSDYIRHHKFQKGRRRKVKNERIET